MIYIFQLNMAAVTYWIIKWTIKRRSNISYKVYKIYFEIWSNYQNVFF